MKNYWINLPVRDLQASTDFYTAIGFSLNPKYPNSANSASILIGNYPMPIMLFPERDFALIAKLSTGTQYGNETLVSFEAESTEEVDALVIKIHQAGGTVLEPAAWIQNWIYGCLFQDVDGHRWNCIFMDYSKLK